MKKQFARVVTALMVLLLLTTSACGLTAQKTDSAQTYMTVEEYYDGMARELKRNPTRLKSRMGQKSQPFEGEITKIVGASIQFHVDPRRFRKDHYVTCSFRTTNDVLYLNIGDYVGRRGGPGSSLPKHRTPLR